MRVQRSDARSVLMHRDAQQTRRHRADGDRAFFLFWERKPRILFIVHTPARTQLIQSEQV
jgi:hypothetical protein